MICPFGNEKCTCYVVKPSVSDGWVSSVGGREYGPYLSRDMALQLAVADLHQQRQSGSSVRLVVEDGQGGVSAERCLCAEAGQ